MQLSRHLLRACHAVVDPRRARVALAGIASFLAVSALSSAPRSEVVGLDLRGTYYREGTPYGKMTVYNPAGQLSVKPADWLAVRAGWEADVVSGASIKTSAGRPWSSDSSISPRPPAARSLPRGSRRRRNG
ncbi:MAG: hypothetical protein NVS9B8_12530 [Candidatus Limnocylindrales bacterium]